MTTSIFIEILVKELTHLKGPVQRCTILLEDGIILFITLQLQKENLLERVQTWAPTNCFPCKEERAVHFVACNSTPDIRFGLALSALRKHGGFPSPR
jgi:hypothetical protein